MSLQVWLPLNGNYNNQGISDLKFESLGSINFNTVGKISQYGPHNTNAGNRTIISDEKINVGNNQSLFCWVKADSFNTDANLTGLGGQHRYYDAAPSNLGLTMTYVDASHAKISANTAIGTTRTYTTYTGTTLIPTNTWTHVGYTYDGTYLRLYVNGKLDATHTLPGMVIKEDYVHVMSWSLVGQSDRDVFTHYNLCGSIQDFRLYDHCLSDKEISEISKGLVLHYTFNDPYFESTTNTFSSINTTLQNASLGEAATWNNQASGTQQVVNAYGRKCYKFTFNGGSNRFYVTTPNPAVKATYSCKIYCESTTGVRLHIERDPHYSWTGGDAIYTTPGRWQTVSLTLDNSYADETCYFFIMGTSAAPVYVCDIQVEAKDHVTPYTPSSRTNDTIVDCSGYGYNATLTDTSKYSYTTDTIRGTGAIHSVGAPTAIIQSSLNPSFITNGTLVVWYKKDSSAMNYNSGNFLMATQANSGQWLCATSGDSPPFNSSSNYTHWYVDGIEQNKSNFTDTDWHMYSPTGINLSSWTSLSFQAHGDDSWLYRGNIAEIRIYSTELSVADLRDLYNTSASIDDKGNIYVREVVEQ